MRTSRAWGAPSWSLSLSKKRAFESRHFCIGRSNRLTASKCLTDFPSLLLSFKLVTSKRPIRARSFWEVTVPLAGETKGGFFSMSKAHRAYRNDTISASYVCMAGIHPWHIRCNNTQGERRSLIVEGMLHERLESAGA